MTATEIELQPVTGQPGTPSGWIARHPFVIALLLALLAGGVYRIHYSYSQIGDTVGNELLPINLLHGHGFNFAPESASPSATCARFGSEEKRLANT